MKDGKSIGVTVMNALEVAFSGSAKPEGTAERAGKEVDKATAKVGRQVEKIGESIKDAANGIKK